MSTSCEYSPVPTGELYDEEVDLSILAPHSLDGKGRSAEQTAVRDGRRVLETWTSSALLLLLLASIVWLGVDHLSHTHSSSSRHSSSRLPAFTNFTVDYTLPRTRWPGLIDPQQPQLPSPADSPGTDPFIVGSPHRFTSLRGAVISLFTPNQESYLLAHFQDNERQFIAPMADHSDWVIFYTLFPDNAEGTLHRLLVERLNCHELTQRSGVSLNASSSDLYQRLRHPDMRFPLDVTSIREFETLHGGHVITVPVVVQLPSHLASDPGKMLHDGWLRCHDYTWTLDYILFSGSVFSAQLLWHPIMRGYDYFVKMDLDITWMQPAPAVSIFQSMHSQQCVWMHSSYHTEYEDCGLEAPEAVQEWAESTYGPATRPASFQSEWWPSMDYYFGNFVGGWLGWLRSEENARLATYLYENDKRPGYFTHRWGDQPPFAKMLGMWFNLTDKEARGLNRTEEAAPTVSAVCDFTGLRNTYFRHK